jgi:RNA-directed DNA polymerase
MTMATTIESIGAPSTSNINWKTINWSKVELHVNKLQIRIAKAFRERRYNKAKALQWLLTHSLSAKLLAVKRVTTNKGAKTPGIDNITWNTSIQKGRAALSLKRLGYKAQPLRRIYIPKKQKDKLRPLSIPTMYCRAMQALYWLSADPIVEMIADKNSYGFRKLRCAADAIEQCFIILSKKGSSQYVLEGDIKSCFDTISHSWLLKHAPMDRVILEKWLDAGYIEKGMQYSMNAGTPQGGIISPTLLNATLSGLEDKVKSLTYSRRDKVYFSTYADDFIITGATPEVLEETVKPAVEAFLNERGLYLSKDKTKITHINEGFDFLGCNIRKYNGKLIIKPSKENVKYFLKDIRLLIKVNNSAKTENLIRLLNPKIRGWANYFSHVCAKDTFSYIGYHLFYALWRWAKRRHPNKGMKWIKRKYFRTHGNRNWMFTAKIKNKQGNRINLDLVDINQVAIKRHIKIRAEATPYNPKYNLYLESRVRTPQTRKCQ